MSQKQLCPFLTIKLTKGRKTDSINRRKQLFYNFSDFSPAFKKIEWMDQVMSQIIHSYPIQGILSLF